MQQVDALLRAIFLGLPSFTNPSFTDLAVALVVVAGFAWLSASRGKVSGAFPALNRAKLERSRSKSPIPGEERRSYDRTSYRKNGTHGGSSSRPPPSASNTDSSAQQSGLSGYETNKKPSKHQNWWEGCHPASLAGNQQYQHAKLKQNVKQPYQCRETYPGGQPNGHVTQPPRRVWPPLTKNSTPQSTFGTITSMLPDSLKRAISGGCGQHPCTSAGCNGLSNPRNYCFANSLLQCVRHVRGFCEQLDSALDVEGDGGPAFVVAFAIGSLMRQLNAGCNINSARGCKSTVNSMECYSELATRTHLLSATASQQQQQDPHEFFELFLLEDLSRFHTAKQEREHGNAWRREEQRLSAEEEQVEQQLLQIQFRRGGEEYRQMVKRRGELVWQKHELRSRDSVVGLFTGQVVRGSLCSTCDRLSAKAEIVNVLPLALSTVGSDGPQTTTLEKCFENMIQTENQGAAQQLEQKICQSVTCRGQRRDARTQQLLLKLPQCLVICLKRYSNDVATGQISKLQTEVEVPLDDLDLHDYHFDPASIEECSKYDLVAVCTHLGCSMLSGHYVAYCRDRRRRCGGVLQSLDYGEGAGMWRRYDDAAVTEVQPADVMRAARTDGYILFYQRQQQLAVGAGAGLDS